MAARAGGASVGRILDYQRISFGGPSPAATQYSATDGAKQLSISQGSWRHHFICDLVGFIVNGILYRFAIVHFLVTETSRLLLGGAQSRKDTRVLT